MRFSCPPAWESVSPPSMDSRFTASFRSESLQQVLTLLDITCGIKSKIKSPTEVELR